MPLKRELAPFLLSVVMQLANSEIPIAGYPQLRWPVSSVPTTQGVGGEATTPNTPPGPAAPEVRTGPFPGDFCHSGKEILQLNRKFSQWFPPAFRSRPWHWLGASLVSQRCTPIVTPFL